MGLESSMTAGVGADTFARGSVNVDQTTYQHSRTYKNTIASSFKKIACSRRAPCS